MTLQRLVFRKSQKALCARLDQADDLAAAIDELDLPRPRPVIVLVGGAGGIPREAMEMISHVTREIHQSAEENAAVLVDGGTSSGVMASLGRARQRSASKFPLLGVVVERLARVPARPRNLGWLRLRLASSPLDPAHSHFLLVPGSDWGDESAWIAKTATLIAGEKPSVTVLVNGGEISRQDLANSLKENRPVIVVAGTGRLADELAAAPPAEFPLPNPEQASLVHIVHAQDDGAVSRAIDEILNG